MKKNKKRFLIRIFSIGCILLTGIAFGQTRTTVLLNQSTNAEKYVFKPGLLPSNLVINDDDVLFNITIRENTLNENESRNLYIYKNGDLNTSLGVQTNINENTKQELQISLNLHNDLPKLKTNVELVSKFSPTTNPEKISFYPSLPGATNYQLNNQPKLVVNYEVSKEPYNANWSQNGSNAQHTNAIPWKWNSTNSEINFDTSENNGLSGKIQIDKTLLYKEKPIVFYIEDGNFYVSRLNASLQRISKIQLNGFPNVKPVIDQQGRMYVVKYGTFTVINLETETKEEFNLINKVTDYFKSTTNLTVTDDITIGYDGTLYLPIAKNGRDGIVALAAYPDFKPRWYYPTTNPVGPISLSNQEHLAFFLESDIQKQKSKLVVLNNINGTVLATSETTLAAFNNDKNYYIPPVVVQKVDEKYNLYVLNGNKFAEKLFVFEVPDAILTSDEPKPLTLQPQNTIEPSTSQISQPVLSGAENVFFIMDGTLTKYDATNKAIQTVTNSTTFDKESVILANATNQLVINSKSGMYYVDANAISPKVTQVLSFSNNNEPYKTLMTPNLSVYHFTSNKCNFIKTTFSGSGDSPRKLSAFDNNTVYHSSKININNTTIPYTISTIITAKTIGIGKGFSIQKGANVSFKIN